MVVGNLLAGRRILFLDHLPVVARRRFMTNDLLGVLRQQSLEHAVVDVFLRRDVGLRRADVRPDDALSRHVAGHGRGAGLLRGVRHTGAADLQGVLPEACRWRKPSARSRRSTSGQVTLAGVAVCLLGIGIAALAG